MWSAQSSLGHLFDDEGDTNQKSQSSSGPDETVVGQLAGT